MAVLLRSLCNNRLLTAWCFIFLFSVLTIVPLFTYLSTDNTYKPKEYGGMLRRQTPSSCHGLTYRQRKHDHLLLAREKRSRVRCKNPRRKSFATLLDPKKFVLSRYTVERNDTSVEDSNRLNLILNAIDLKAYVVEEHQQISSNCVLSDKKCTCSCVGSSFTNCSVDVIPLFGTSCISRPAFTGKLYEYGDMQTAICDNGLPHLMTADSFLRNSYRDLIFVHPINKLYPRHNLTYEQNFIQNQLRLNSPIIDCCDFSVVKEFVSATLEDLNSLTNMLCLKEFRVVGCYCIAAWYKSNDLGMYWFADEDISIVFTSWMGLERDDSDILIPLKEEKKPETAATDSDQPSPPTLLKKIDKDQPNPHGVVRRRHHSSLAKMVLQQTKKYIKAMAQGRQYIVVHLHVDKSFNGHVEQPDFKFYYQSCLFKVKTTIDKLTTEHSDAMVFYFLDYSRELTNEYENNTISIQLNLIHTILLGSKNQIQHYLPEKYGGRDDPPFVTLVEQEFMCRASYLITVGGGQIQDRLKKRFLKMHFRKKMEDFEYCDSDPSNTVPKYIAH